MVLGQLLIICTSRLWWFFTVLSLMGVAKARLPPLALVDQPYGACVKLYTYWKNLFKQTSKLPRKFPSACSASMLDRGLGLSPVHGTDAPLASGGIRMLRELGSKHSPQMSFLVPSQPLKIPAQSLWLFVHSCAVSSLLLRAESSWQCTSPPPPTVQTPGPSPNLHRRHRSLQACDDHYTFQLRFLCVL